MPLERRKHKHKHTHTHTQRHTNTHTYTHRSWGLHYVLMWCLAKTSHILFLLLFICSKCQAGSAINYMQEGDLRSWCVIWRLVVPLYSLRLDFLPVVLTLVLLCFVSYTIAIKQHFKLQKVTSCPTSQVLLLQESQLVKRWKKTALLKSIRNLMSHYSKDLFPSLKIFTPTLLLYLRYE